MTSRFAMFKGSFTVPSTGEEDDEYAPSMDIRLPYSSDDSPYDLSEMYWHEASPKAIRTFVDETLWDLNPHLQSVVSKDVARMAISQTISISMEKPVLMFDHEDQASSPIHVLVESWKDRLYEMQNGDEESVLDYSDYDLVSEQVEQLTDLSDVLVQKKKWTKAEARWCKEQLHRQALKHGAVPGDEVEFWMSCTPNRDYTLTMEIPLKVTVSSSVETLAAVLF